MVGKYRAHNYMPVTNISYKYGLGRGDFRTVSHKEMTRITIKAACIFVLTILQNVQLNGSAT